MTFFASHFLFHIFFIHQLLFAAYADKYLPAYARNAPHHLLKNDIFKQMLRDLDYLPGRIRNFAPMMEDYTLTALAKEAAVSAKSPNSKKEMFEDPTLNFLSKRHPDALQLLRILSLFPEDARRGGGPSGGRSRRHLACGPRAQPSIFLPKPLSHAQAVFVPARQPREFPQ